MSKLKIFANETRKVSNRRFAPTIKFGNKSAYVSTAASSKLKLKHGEELLFAQDEESGDYYLAPKPEDHPAVGFRLTKAGSEPQSEGPRPLTINTQHFPLNDKLKGNKYQLANDAQTDQGLRWYRLQRVEPPKYN